MFAYRTKGFFAWEEPCFHSSADSDFPLGHLDSARPSDRILLSDSGYCLVLRRKEEELGLSVLHPYSDQVQAGLKIPI